MWRLFLRGRCLYYVVKVGGTANVPFAGLLAGATAIVTDVGGMAEVVGLANAGLEVSDPSQRDGRGGSAHSKQ